MVFPLLASFASINGEISSSREFQWLSSALFGIIFCRILEICVVWYALFGFLELMVFVYLIKEIVSGLSHGRTFKGCKRLFSLVVLYVSWVWIGLQVFYKIYRLTDSISLICIEGYKKLSEKEKIEWSNRGFSTIHALVAASASLYLLLFSDLFDEYSHAELIVNRTSVMSNVTLGFSVGYFLSDLAMIIWYYPALGGLEYLLHHGLSLFAIFQSLLSGQGQIYILMVLFSEITTPFVNLRWYLDMAGKKSSKFYIYNGIALFFGWLVARVILFIYFFAHMYSHFGQVKKIFPLGFYSLLTIPTTLSLLNLFWFWKITRGMIRTLLKAKKNRRQ